MRWHREVYLELMTFGRVERPMFVELFGRLVGVEQEWRSQGATQEEIDLTAFDWDYVPITGCGAELGPRNNLQLITLEETDEYLIQRDQLGRTMKLCKRVATIALPLDHPVKTMDDWLKIKSWFEYAPDRIDWTRVEQARRAQAEGALVVAHIPGGFDFPRQLMGEEGACVCYYEQPELMHDMLATIGDTAERVLDQISAQLPIDQLSLPEDLAGKSGPLVGPAQIAEFIKPYFTRIWQLLSSRGARLFSMDSDGNLNPVIKAFLDCGLNTLEPNEPAAGMDIVQIRRQYGNRLALLGGIDKHVLRTSKTEIRRELEYKMQPLMRASGTVFGLDHRIPNGTPLENYRYYVDTGREILGLPPRSTASQGWRRMAF